jgi:hypothetical protein
MISADTDTSTGTSPYALFLLLIFVVAPILRYWEDGGRFVGLRRALPVALRWMLRWTLRVGCCAGALFLLIRFIHWAWTF